MQQALKQENNYLQTQKGNTKYVFLKDRVAQSCPSVIRVR